MAAYEEKTGGNVLAIAHNGNVSNGRMFPTVEDFGKKIDRAYAEERIKWERLYEVTQTKGTGEAHPMLSPNDEFASFELWDKGNLDGSVAKQRDGMLEFEYARSALKNGLVLEQRLGVNPYKFGMIGSSDAHTGWPPWKRTTSSARPPPRSRVRSVCTATFIKDPKTGITIMDWEYPRPATPPCGPGEHPRGALGRDARRETYATTGSRMAVRFFGGWDFERPRTRRNRLPAAVGYSKGVPMGGDLGQMRPRARRRASWLPHSRTPSAPTSTASRSSRAGWTRRARLHEKVYDVVWAGQAQARPPANCPPSAAPSMSPRDLDQLHRRARADRGLDGPGVRSRQRAFYYGRVLEIPTPRWTAYDAVRFRRRRRCPGPGHDDRRTRLHLADLVHAGHR
jgi:hypothetical protein